MLEFKPITDDSDAISHFYAARIYYSPTDGRKQNLEKAFKHFSLSAEKGSLDALHAIGVMYRKGEYVPRRPRRGRR